ncbi:hypothetical protein [Streptomyces chartreusis]|uniref:hypothetical protein n=1 Tax=Streptomyces chartreusis TaxID=1969 RepID=UPI00380D11EB
MTSTDASTSLEQLPFTAQPGGFDARRYAVELLRRRNRRPSWSSTTTPVPSAARFRFGLYDIDADGA